jgi:beta-glucanase (GH16 family)
MSALPNTWRGLLIMNCLLLMTVSFHAFGNSLQQPAYDVAWAVNVGGPAYQALDGTSYQNETSVSGGEPGKIIKVLGSDDETLYQSYREGDVRVSHPLAEGVYDITFHFAEPFDIKADERIFEIIIEERTALKDLDVMLLRDVKVKSALTVTIPDVQVIDGQLDIRFRASKAKAILNGLVVRKKRPLPGNWALVWNDEFSADEQPDSNRWTMENWPARKVNSEDQVYTSRSKNVRIEDGMLIIEAHKEAFGGAEYSSGRVQSSGKADFLYGRFEVSAKIPAGMGTWSAIWMLPSNPFTYATTCNDDENWQGSKTCDAWPNSGEIDILEHVGYQLGHVHATVHSEAFYFKKWNQRKGRIPIDNVTEAFHVYALEWSPERIDVFVDDSLYFSYLNPNNGWRAWPFDQPFHLILNLAIGGDWGRAGGPIDDSIFPRQMLVDYVRVYKAKALPH